MYRFILKINWFAKNALTNVLILSKDDVYIDRSGNVYIDRSGNVYIDQSGNTKLVFKDIHRLYYEDIIFIKKNYRRYKYKRGKIILPVPLLCAYFFKYYCLGIRLNSTRLFSDLPFSFSLVDIGLDSPNPEKLILSRETPFLTRKSKQDLALFSESI
jgi:hypothetical protein